MKKLFFLIAVILLTNLLRAQDAGQQEVAFKTDGPKGWLCDGYDICWSYHYPTGSVISVPDMPFAEDWRVNAENPLVLTGDVNGDGMLEIVYHSNNVLYALNRKGEELWEKSLGFIEPYLRISLDDFTNDGIPEIIANSRTNSTVKLLFYDGSGNLIKEISESEGVSGDNAIHSRAIMDIDNDGSIELVAWRLSSYELWSRGVEVFDFESGNPEWFYSIGPGIFTLNVADITGGPEKEIIAGTFGPANGHSVNGFSDSRCYAICWDANGNLLWSRQFEGSGYVDSYAAVHDLDGDGHNEVIYTSRAHGWNPWEGNLGRIYLLNPDNGEIIKEYNAGKPLVINGIADIIGDSDKEILVSYIDGATHTGKILMFDDSLNLLNEYIVQGSLSGVSAINDLNGDGNLEIIVVKSMARELVILDNHLGELWSLSFPDELRDAIPSDLDNDGINELIISTSNSLEVWKLTLKPYFHDLEDKLACKDDSVILAATVLGIPPIYYQWQKDGVNISGATDSVFTLPGVQYEDGGEYRCVATNEYGADTSNTAMVIVEFSIPTNIMGFADVLTYQVATYSVDPQEGHTYEFMVEGGNCIDGTENSITVHWGAAGWGSVKLIETSELGCVADTNSLNVYIGNLGIEELKTQGLVIYPNPAGRIVDCQLSIVDFQRISMKILDLYGREVRVLLDETKSPGEYTVRVDVSDLPAGVYLVRLQGGGQSAMRKLVVR